MKRIRTINDDLYQWGSFHLRHYGAAVYDPVKFLPVSDCHQHKPTGGLWTSPVDAEWGWKQWCEGENFGDLSVWFDVHFTGNVLTINEESDLQKLPWCDLGYCTSVVLFQPLLLMGVDAIHLTASGQLTTRFAVPHNLYGWDCETVFVMNAQCLSATE